ncbi:hypothetical protein RIF29_10970 [Crotalaria pallida]|uniref:Uncharacterized protein n=1 Tax=Crotalaria pallida TaxID=3830 RepID=A0AAN9FWK5_CROPI
MATVLMSILYKRFFQGTAISDARGYADGIWCFWDPLLWKVDVLTINFQFIHMHVQWENTNPWLLTAIYGSPQVQSRRTLWHDIQGVAQTVQGPWCIMRDFNTTLHAYEL